MYTVAMGPQHLSNFKDVSCTDGTHFDSSHGLPGPLPGAFDAEVGHRRCRFPKKCILIEEHTARFAIVHGKTSVHPGYILQAATPASKALMSQCRQNSDEAQEKEPVAPRWPWCLFSRFFTPEKTVMTTEEIEDEVSDDWVLVENTEADSDCVTSSQ